MHPVVLQVIATVAAVSLAAAASAQTAAPQPPPAPAFVVESANGDNRLQLGVLVQFDGRFTADRPASPAADTFLARRVRPIFQGRVARNFDYFFVLDLAAVPYVRDAYFDTRIADAFRVRAGKTKVPLGLERLHFANVLLFVERGFPTALTPDRDIGLHVLGDVVGRRLSYTLAVVNGGTDGANVELDADDAKDLVARVIVSPWIGSPDHLLAGLGVGIAGTTGHAGTGLPVIRSANLQPIFEYSGASGDGRRRRVSPQAFFYRGPWGSFAEYVTSEGGVRRAGVTTDVAHAAWQVAASWVLTGERATDRGVRPRVSFDAAARRFGAVQLAARYHAFRVDDAAFTRSVAAPGSSRGADALTVGVNWYLSPFVKWVANVERTLYQETAGLRRPADTTFLLRGQLSF